MRHMFVVHITTQQTHESGRYLSKQVLDVINDKRNRKSNLSRTDANMYRRTSYLNQRPFKAASKQEKELIVVMQAFFVRFMTMDNYRISQNLSFSLLDLSFL